MSTGSVSDLWRRTLDDPTFGTLSAALAVPSSNAQWYVDSNALGSANGQDWTNAALTINAAVTLASAGDTIFVAEGHAETISAAAGVSLSKAGLRVIGLGHGNLRPTLTLSATGSTVLMGTANCRLSNFVFALTADSTIVVDIDAAGCQVDRCYFPARSAATAREYVTAIDVNGGTANACDRTRILYNEFLSTANAGSDRAIELGEVADDVWCVGNVIDGDWADAGIHNPTGKTLTNLKLMDNIVRNRQTGDHAIELVSACTGEATGNRLFADTAGTVLDPGSLFCADNFESSAIDIPGVATPLASVDVATNLIGVDDADNAGATTNVVSNRDGTLLERSEFVMDQFLAAPRAVEKSDGAVLSGDDDIFTITGGPVRATIYAIVTTSIGAGTTNVKYTHTTTTPGTTTDLNAGAVDIDADAAGTSYRNINTTSVFTPVTAGTVLMGNAFATDDHEFLLPIGTVRFNSSAARSGVIKHYMMYTPLSENSRVVAAA